MNRVEAADKVTGRARYAYEYQGLDGPWPEPPAYVYPVQSPVARGRVLAVHPDDALAVSGVLAVLSCMEPPELGSRDQAELALFQTREITYRGQLVAAVVAGTLESARAAAAAVRVDYAGEQHDVALRADHPGLYAPERVNPALPGQTSYGDVEAGLAASAARVDVTYTTPVLHNNPMEPHAALAVLAARAAGRPVKIALTRQQMFELTGYRTPTIQRLQLGADVSGRLTAVAHDVAEQTSIRTEFAEQTAACTRVMYATPAMRTTHRLVRLAVPAPSWIRAPGECPGMYALESAVDELAAEAGLDPVELRIRNEPDAEPESGLPFSSRNLVACLRDGARRFGWADRDPRPGARRDGRWLTGTGVAASTYPARRQPSSATAAAVDGEFVIRIAAADIGTGARTALTQIAAETLGVPPGQVRVELGDSDLPHAWLAGGSMGTASWGSAVVKACENLLKSDSGHGSADTTDDVAGDRGWARQAPRVTGLPVKEEASCREAAGAASREPANCQEP